ncbi:MAG: glycosyltransferase family 39 protein [Planctomycetota bacterium]
MSLSWQRLGIAIFLLALVRIAVLFVMNDSLYRQPANDPDAYALHAHNLGMTGTFGPAANEPSAYRPPGYPLLLIPFCVTTPPRIWGILLLHFAAGIVTVLGVWRIASRMDGPSCGWTAMLFVAVDPLLARQAGLVMTEAVFTAFVTGLLAGWIKPRIPHAGTILDRLAMGILLALAGLTRPVAWLVWGTAFLVDACLSRRLREWCSILAIAILVASPWIARNWMLLGRPILTTTHGGYTLWLGMNPVFYREVVVKGNPIWPEDSFQNWTRENARLTEGLEEWERDAFFQKQAMNWMKEHPSDTALCVLHHAASFWSPGPNYGPRWARIGVSAFYLGLFVLAAIGLFQRVTWTPPYLVLPLSLLAYFLPHVVYWSNVRMRAPLTPVLAVLAALGWITIARFRREFRSTSTATPGSIQ